MIENKYEIIDTVEDASKVGYAFTQFALRIFYGVSGVESLKNGMDRYMVERFSQRLEYFTFEQEHLTKEQKKEFYDDLKYNKQNIAYMYELIDEARRTVYDFHARILAKVCVELVKNKDLTYFQSSLLANLQSLTSRDIDKIYNFLEEYIEIDDYNKELLFKVKDYEDIVVFQKCMQLGITTNVDTRGRLGNFQGKTLLDDRLCHLTGFAEEFYNIINETNSSSK
ncbi:MAG: hypothetical protein WBF48_12100 [Halarcobacter sp.]